MIPCFLVSSDSKMRENLPSNLSLYQSYFQNSFRLVLSRSVWSCCGFSGQCCGFGCGQNPGPRRVVPGRDGEAPNRKGRRSRVGLASCCLYHFGVLFMPSFPPVLISDTISFLAVRTSSILSSSNPLIITFPASHTLF